MSEKRIQHMQQTLPGLSSPDIVDSYLATNTPHPRIAEQDSSIVVEPFIESEPFKTAIAAYEASDRTYHDKTGAAVDIAAIVRKTLRYQTYAQSTAPLTPEQLAETQETNCFGYTIFMSQALEVAKIDHLIAYANGHSFVLIPDKEADHLFAIDSVTRKFDGTFDKAVSGISPRKQLEEGKKFAVNHLNTKKLLELRQLTPKTDEITVKSPWISHLKPMESGIKRFSQEQNDHDYVLRLVTYPAALGREVLQSLSDARVFRNMGELDASAQAFRNMKGYYPDIDARNNLRDAHDLRTKLFTHRKWGDAILLAEAVDASLDPDDHSKNRLFLAETERRIANLIGQPAVMHSAIIDYQNALPEGNRLRGETIAVAKKQLRRL